MFTKVNKKMLITVIILLIILVIGFAVYKYLVNRGFKKVEIPVEQKQEPYNTQSAHSKDTLTVCVEECGNGVCQKTGPDCKAGDLNCICPETHADCPQDCPAN